MSLSEQLQDIVGSEVVETRPVHDYLQLFFEGKRILTIINPYSYAGGGVASLGGATLERVSEAGRQLSLEFSGGRVLVVDLRDESYNGPEAMTLQRPGLPTVVW